MILNKSKNFNMIQWNKIWKGIGRICVLTILFMATLNISTAKASSNSEFVSSNEVAHSITAFTQGDYLFYKSGNLTKTVIASKNFKTSKITKIAVISQNLQSSDEFYLKGSSIYYHEKGNIYRVGIDGKNKCRLWKGKAIILGFHEDDLFALDKKANEIIKIDSNGNKISLAKLHSVDSKDVILQQDGFYYIVTSSDNTSNGNDPTDRLYYIDFDGQNKTELYSAQDIFDLKSNDKELFFMAISENPNKVEINKIENHKAATIYSTSQQELKDQGCGWFDQFTFTLLAVSTSRVYYGVNFNNAKDMNIYSVGINGEEQNLFLNAYTIKGIYGSAYFRKGNMEDGYLKVVFDCDEAPLEIYLINLQDKSAIKFEGSNYMADSIDLESGYVYYCKAEKHASSAKAYTYGAKKLSEYE
jgi:hypothetical protein